MPLCMKKTVGRTYEISTRLLLLGTYIVTSVSALTYRVSIIRYDFPWLTLASAKCTPPLLFTYCVFLCLVSYDCIPCRLILLVHRKQMFLHDLCGAYPFVAGLAAKGPITIACLSSERQGIAQREIVKCIRLQNTNSACVRRIQETGRDFLFSLGAFPTSFVDYKADRIREEEDEKNRLAQVFPVTFRHASQRSSATYWSTIPRNIANKVYSEMRYAARQEEVGSSLHVLCCKFLQSLRPFPVKLDATGLLIFVDTSNSD